MLLVDLACDTHLSFCKLNSSSEKLLFVRVRLLLYSIWNDVIHGDRSEVQLLLWIDFLFVFSDSYEQHMFEGKDISEAEIIDETYSIYVRLMRTKMAKKPLKTTDQSINKSIITTSSYITWYFFFLFDTLTKSIFSDFTTYRPTSWRSDKTQKNCDAFCSADKKHRVSAYLSEFCKYSVFKGWWLPANLQTKIEISFIDKIETRAKFELLKISAK